MKNKKSKILILIGLVLIIGSIVFLFTNYKRKEAKRLKALELENKIKEGIELSGEYLNEDVQEKILEEDTIYPSDAIGVIRVDKIDIILPIYGNADKKSLANGVGVVETTEAPSSEPDTISVLAGHRGGMGDNQSFLNIDKLALEDEVVVTTHKETLYYKVVDKEVIEATDWSKFIREHDKTKLFLLSCHPYPKNDKRLLIKTELYKTIIN